MNIMEDVNLFKKELKLNLSSIIRKVKILRDK